MHKDEWIAAALSDDTMVVELLLSLTQSSSDSYLSMPPNPLVLSQLRWGNRQPRSRLMTGVKKELEPTATRCSPTTPLSWSGGGSTSPSDGYDESSRPSDTSIAVRSKGTFTNETNTTNRRSRRKKSFTELKEEESLLLKERVHLKRELASIHVTLKEQRTRSENLKRIKLDFSLQSADQTVAPSNEPDVAFSNQYNKMEASSLLPRHSTGDDPVSSDSCEGQKDVETRERCFILPDLNMAPYEEIGFETL